ncbi:hypothetical protein Tco_1114645 [Tanacetum coccineum]|uniref:Uncharacterized protein n=1 Tax=Tanacetum coccineum TaxID=301880 RepID=A0ABQ5IXY9_9ASTR
MAETLAESYVEVHSAPPRPCHDTANPRRVGGRRVHGEVKDQKFINDVKNKDQAEYSDDGGESMRCKVTEETDGGKCGMDDNVANNTRRNKEHNDCDQGKNSGVIVEEVLMDDCNDVGYSGLEEEQCQVQSDTQMPPIYVNSKKMEGNVWNKSFTLAVTKNITEYDRNLEYIPTELNENGIYMVFLMMLWFLGEVKSGSDRAGFTP